MHLGRSVGGGWGFVTRGSPVSTMTETEVKGPPLVLQREVKAEESTTRTPDTLGTVTRWVTRRHHDGDGDVTAFKGRAA